MKTGNILLGVLAGVAAGAALGILFAPEKGSNTRNMIKKTGNDTIGELESKIDKLLKSLDRSAQEKAVQAKDIVMDKAGDIQKAVKTVIS